MTFKLIFVLTICIKECLTNIFQATEITNNKLFVITVHIHVSHDWYKMEATGVNVSGNSNEENSFWLAFNQASNHSSLAVNFNNVQYMLKSSVTAKQPSFVAKFDPLTSTNFSI